MSRPWLYVARLLLVLSTGAVQGTPSRPELEMRALGGAHPLLHGEAVNIDMAITTQLSFNRGLISGHERDRIFRCMEGLGLALWHESCSDLPMLLRVCTCSTCVRCTAAGDKHAAAVLWQPAATAGHLLSDCQETHHLVCSTV